MNIDNNFFYFSDHRNWEACQELEETENPNVTLNFFLEHAFEFTITIIILTFVSYFTTGEIEILYGGLITGLVMLFFKRLFKLTQFKIPVHKVERIQLEESKLTVKFANSKNQQISFTKKLDDKAETTDIKEFLREHFTHKLNIA